MNLYERLSTRLQETSYLEEVHRDTLITLAWSMFASGCLIVIRSLYPDGNLGNMLAAGALFAGMSGALRFRERAFRVAKYWLVGWLVVAIAIGLLGNPGSVVRFFFAVPIFLAGLLMSRSGIVAITLLAAVSQTGIALYNGASWGDEGQIISPLLLFLIVAVTSWLGSLQFRSELETAEYSYAESRKLLDEVREHRATLTRTVAALEEANARIKEINAELVEARDAAQAADRLKTEFLAHTSHELRTPLNAILNFTAFVADGLMGEVNAEQKDALHKVMDSSNHLLSLINDILDIAKIEAGMMHLFIEEVDVNAVLNTALTTAQGLLKDKSVELTMNIEPLPTIAGDRRRLRQIFTNLLSNAVKFTPQGSITVEACARDGQIQVTVRDTGIGIAPADQEKVFQAFAQAKHDLDNVTGTGLGLPICKHFIEAHGGRLRLESEVGIGTAFHVSLPAESPLRSSAMNVPTTKRS